MSTDLHDLVKAEVCETWEELRTKPGSFPESPPGWQFNGPEEAERYPAIQWIFRGHADREWSLQPSIERLGGDVDWCVVEPDLVQTFQRKAHLYYPNIPAADEIVDWLAMMQHHHAPTRLLDFTYSPYVATFFAADNFTCTAEYSEIWAIESMALRNRRSKMKSQEAVLEFSQLPLRTNAIDDALQKVERLR